jgi:hypothetical protein
MPLDFLNHYYRFASMMTDKQFIFRENIFEKISSNKGFEEILKEMKKNEGYRTLSIPFSFVMGIFNYLSSMMHVANQLFASEVILKYCLSNKMGLCILEMKAHSDDSAGFCFHEDQKSIKPAVLIYDWLLKSNNHMLSVKKSQVNLNVYFEFLSTLYLKDQLLPVIPKFMGTLPFSATDKGYQADMAFAVSQSIEMCQYGATFEESFIIMKLAERYIQRIYNFGKIEMDTPYHYTGGIDAHPIELLIAGSDSELLKHYTYNRKSLDGIMSVLDAAGLITEGDTEGLALKWDMSSRLNPKFRAMYEKELAVLAQDKDFSESWTLSNCKLGNSTLNSAWYLKKLFDPSYYSSMIKEPGERRFARIYGAFGHRTVFTKEGTRVDVNRLHISLTQKFNVEPLAFKYYEKSFDVIKVLNFELINFWEVCESLTYDPLLIHSKTTCKPVRLTAKFPYLNNRSNINPDFYVVMKKEPKYLGLLGVKKYNQNSIDTLDDTFKNLGFDLDSLSANDLQKLVNKIVGKTNTTKYMYAYTTSDNRNIDSYESMLGLIQRNSFANKKISINVSGAVKTDMKLRFLKGRIPDSIAQFISCCWQIQLFEEYDIIDEDIYVAHPLDVLNKAYEKVQPDWIPIVKMALCTGQVNLSEMDYWKHWIRPQRKLLDRWYGLGILLVKLPETTVIFRIEDYTVNEVCLVRPKLGFYSAASNWFMNVILTNDINLKTYLVKSDLVSGHKEYLGFSEGRGWGYGRPGMFDAVCPDHVEADVFDHNLLSFTSFISRKLGKTVALCNGNNYVINFFLDYQSARFTHVSDMIDFAKIQDYMHRPKLKRFLISSATDLNIDLKIDKNVLRNNIGSTKLYRAIFGHPDSQSLINYKENPNYFMEAMVKYKDVNPTFGMLTKEEMLTVHLDPYAAYLPSYFMDQLRSLGTSSLSDVDLENVLDVLSRANTVEEKKDAVSTILATFGGQVAYQTLVLDSVKNKDLINNCKFLGSDAPLMDVIGAIVEMAALALDDSTITSHSLSRMRAKFDRKSSNSNFLHLLSTTACFSAMSFSSPVCKGIENVRVFKNVLSELFLTGLDKVMMQMSGNYDILRSSNMSISHDEFMDWICDIFDSFSSNVWLSMPPTTEEIDKVFKTAKTKRIVNMLIKVLPTRVHFRHKKKTKTIDSAFQVTSKRVGFLRRKFDWLSEMDQETLLDMLLDMEEDDFEIECEDEAEEGPSHGLVFSPSMESFRIQCVRGSARHLLVFSTGLAGSDIGGLFLPFEKVKCSSVYDAMIHNDLKCYLFSTSKTPKISIHNYRLMESFEHRAQFNKKEFVNNSVVIEGEMYTKEDVYNEHHLRKMLLVLQKPWYNKGIVKTGVNRVITNLITDGLLQVKPNSETENLYRQFKEIYDNPKSESERINVIEQTADIFANIDFNAILQADTDIRLGPDIQEKRKKESLARALSKHTKKTQFTRPVDVIYDRQFRWEIESLIPGFYRQLINQEISLTKYQKLTLKSLIRMGRSKRVKNITKYCFVWQAILTMAGDTNSHNQLQKDFFSTACEMISEGTESDDETLSYDYMDEFVPDKEIELALDLRTLFQR